MRKKIIFVHSAGEQSLDEGSELLLKYLQENLGEEYNIIQPKMPNPENPRYLRWKEKVVETLSNISGEVILVGHSLGGSVLLKLLSENKIYQKIKGLFMVAVPHWGLNDWEIEEFTLKKDYVSKLPPLPHIYLYHSRNDEWVPFSHILQYGSQLPKAIMRPIEGGEHEFFNGLPQLVEDIKNLDYD